MGALLFDILYALAVIPTAVFITCFTCGLLGVGPAVEAPSHFSIWRRVVYYASHRRIRDYFIPCFSIKILNGLLRPLIGYDHGQLLTLPEIIFDALFCWVVMAMFIRWEAWAFRHRWFGLEDPELWTEGMTREKFLQQRTWKTGLEFIIAEVQRTRGANV